LGVTQLQAVKHNNQMLLH